MCLTHDLLGLVGLGYTFRCITFLAVLHFSCRDKNVPYSYDGLYCIVDAKLEPSATGTKVCK